jgi:TetR/AcrR family transcriptional regulator, transcriptional repressor for nem operon
MGRTSDAKQKILNAAELLIEQRGYSALGVAEICKAAGVPKGSFYYFFESKEALALAVIDGHWEVQRRTWEQILGSDARPSSPLEQQLFSTSALEQLRRLFEATEAELRAGQAGSGTVSGCLFGNLTLEMSNQTEVIRGRLQEIFDDQVDMVASVVARARERREVSVTDSRQAARSIVAQLEGQIMFAKLYNDTSGLGILWDNCLALLGAGAQVSASR